jgi:hypothetical protein
MPKYSVNIKNSFYQCSCDPVELDEKELEELEQWRDKISKGELPELNVNGFITLLIDGNKRYFTRRDLENSVISIYKV